MRLGRVSSEFISCDFLCMCDCLDWCGFSESTALTIIHHLYKYILTNAILNTAAYTSEKTP